MAGLNLVSVCLVIIWFISMGLIVWSHVWHAKSKKQNEAKKQI